MRTDLATLLSGTLALALGSGCGSSAPHAPPAPLEVATAEPTGVRVRTSRPAMTMVLPPAPRGTGPSIATDEPDPGACAVTAATSFGAGCHALVPTKISATNGADTAVNAFDQSTCTSWSAKAMAPQSIVVDLGAPTDIDALVLVPEMSASGSVRHKIEVSDDGVRFESSQRIESPMSDGSAAALKLPRRERARFVRFATESSPSMVAWREIAVVRCD